MTSGMLGSVMLILLFESIFSLDRTITFLMFGLESVTAKAFENPSPSIEITFPAFARLEFYT